jgi:hypothetical protein
VIVPDRNEGDVEEISTQEREGLDFVYADDIGDVLQTALMPNGRGSGRRRVGKAAERRGTRRDGKPGVG